MPSDMTKTRNGLENGLAMDWKELAFNALLAIEIHCIVNI